MTRALRIRLTLAEDDAKIVMDALMSSKGDRPATNRERWLAEEVRTALEFALAERLEAEEIAKRTEEARQARAQGHVLTPRQAECLAAVRAGQGPFYRLDSLWGWRRARSMGGAVNRMVQELIEEGMLTDRRALTDAGAERLAAWEAKHGKIEPKPAR